MASTFGSVDEVNKQRDETGKKFEQLDPLNLLEGYNGANHWINLNYLSKGLSKHRGTRKILRIEKTPHDEDYIDLLNQNYKFSDGTKQSYIDFIKNKRIELNTIVDEIGAQRFWNWLKDKLIETFPTRDYNRAIRIPNYVLTPTMEDFEEKLKRSIAVILRPKVGELAEDLQNTDGLINTDDKLDEINDELLDTLLEHEDILKIDSSLEKLMKKLVN